MLNQLKIYLDLDGCFADFDRAVADAHDMNRINWKEVKWSIIENMPNFFLNLEVIPGSKEAFDHIVGLGYETEILTALPDPTVNLVTAPADKLMWVRRELHPTIQVNCSAGWERKICWVAPNHILVDDMQRNIDHWEEHDGIGVHHNGDWDLTIAKIKFAIDRHSLRNK